jgi:hypothetical protein
LLKQTIREPNDAYYRLQTDVGRNAYGNVMSTSQSTVASDAGPAEARISGVSYDADEIFPATITNALGQISYVAYDERFGTPIAAADSNGIATQRAYDSFGRTTRELTPATETDVSYAAATYDGAEPVPVRAVLSTTVETTGYGPATVLVDSFGRPVKHRSSGLLDRTVTSETEYDNAGRPSRSSRPHSPLDTTQGVVVNDYDSASQLVHVTLPRGRVAVRRSVWLRPLGPRDCRWQRRPERDVLAPRRHVPGALA